MESLTFLVWSEVTLYMYLFADGLLYLLEWANERKLQKGILVQLILIVVENCLVFYLSVESYIIRWFVNRRICMAAAYQFLNYNSILVCEMSFCDQ